MICLGQLRYAWTAPSLPGLPTCRSCVTCLGRYELAPSNANGVSGVCVGGRGRDLAGCCSQWGETLTAARQNVGKTVTSTQPSHYSSRDNVSLLKLPWVTSHSISELHSKATLCVGSKQIKTIVVYKEILKVRLHLRPSQEYWMDVELQDLTFYHRNPQTHLQLSSLKL